jgi:hypothetical protein
MNNPVQIDPNKLQQLFRENATLRILVEDLIDPEMYGHRLKNVLPELFERAAKTREGWK